MYSLFVMHTKVFGEDGFVVFLLKGRQSSVQDHLTLSWQVQQHLGQKQTGWTCHQASVDIIQDSYVGVFYSLFYCYEQGRLSYRHNNLF